MFNPCTLLTDLSEFLRVIQLSGQPTSHWDEKSTGSGSGTQDWGLFGQTSYTKVVTYIMRGTGEWMTKQLMKVIVMKLISKAHQLIKLIELKLISKADQLIKLTELKLIS